MFQVIWTEEKIEELKACYPHFSNKGVAEQRGMSIYAIERQAGRLGLSKSEAYRRELNKRQADTLLKANLCYTCNHAYFSTLDTREKAYWLGWLWSDGCVRNNNRSFQVTLSLQKRDEGIVQKFKEAVEADYPIHYERNAARLFLISKQMVTDLQRYGVVPGKSLLATFPRIEWQFASDFVRGVFDGDGHFAITKPKAVTIIGTEPFCQWLAETTSREIGIQSAVYHKKNATYRWVVYTEERLKALARWMYQSNEDGSLPACLERKYARFVDASLV